MSNPSNTVTPIRPAAPAKARKTELLCSASTPASGAATPSKARKPKSIPANAVSVRIPQMCEMLGIGATKAAELVKSGAVESRLIGKTRLITVRSIIALAHGEAA